MAEQIRAEGHEEDRATRFERLLEAELLRSYRLASVILGNPADAEDATHDAAMRAWRSFDSLRDDTRFGAWFARIVVNVCRRRLARHRPSVVAQDLSVPDPSGRLADQDALAQAMARLTTDHRTVIALRYLEDLTEAQIAERTGVRLGTVKSRLHYALAELRAAYEADARQVEEPTR